MRRGIKMRSMQAQGMPRHGASVACNATRVALSSAVLGAYQQRLVPCPGPAQQNNILAMDLPPCASSSTALTEHAVTWTAGPDPRRSQGKLEARQLTQHICECSSWQELEAMVHQHAQTMNPVHLSALLVRLAKVPRSHAAGHAQHRYDSFLQSVSAMVSHNLDSLDPRALANILWSVATLGFRPSFTLLQRYLFASYLHLPSMKAQEIANLAWAAATMGLQPGHAFLSQLCQQAAVKAHAMKPQELAHCSWAISQLLAAHWETLQPQATATVSASRQHKTGKTSAQHVVEEQQQLRDSVSQAARGLQSAAFQRLDSFQPGELMMLLLAMYKLLRQDDTQQGLPRQEHACTQGDMGASQHCQDQQQRQRQRQWQQDSFNHLLLSGVQKLLQQQQLAALSLLDVCHLACMLSWGRHGAEHGPMARTRVLVRSFCGHVEHYSSSHLSVISPKVLVRLLWALAGLRASLSPAWLAACHNRLARLSAAGCSAPAPGGHSASPKLDGKSLATAVCALTHLHKQRACATLPSGTASTGNASQYGNSSSSVQCNNSSSSSVQCNSSSASSLLHAYHSGRSGLQGTSQKAGSQCIKQGASSLSEDNTKQGLPVQVQKALAAHLHQVPTTQLAQLLAALGQQLPGSASPMHPCLMQALQRELRARFRLPTLPIMGQQPIRHKPAVVYQSQTPQPLQHQQSLGPYPASMQTKSEGSTAPSRQDQHPPPSSLYQLQRVMYGLVQLQLPVDSELLAAILQATLLAAVQASATALGSSSRTDPVDDALKLLLHGARIIARNASRPTKTHDPWLTCRVRLNALAGWLAGHISVLHPVDAYRVLLALHAAKVYGKSIKRQQGLLALAHRVSHGLQAFPPVHLARALTVLAHLGFQPSPRWKDACVQLIHRRTNDCSLGELSSIMWCLAHWRVQIDRQLLPQFVGRLCRLLQQSGTGTPAAADVLRTLWAVTRLQLPTPRLQGRLTQLTLQGLQELSHDDALWLLSIVTTAKQHLLRSQWRKLLHATCRPCLRPKPASHAASAGSCQLQRRKMGHKRQQHQPATATKLAALSAAVQPVVYAHVPAAAAALKQDLQLHRRKVSRRVVHRRTVRRVLARSLTPWHMGWMQHWPTWLKARQRLLAVAATPMLDDSSAAAR